MMRNPLQKPEIEISLSESYPIIIDLGMYLNMSVECGEQATLYFDIGFGFEEDLV